MEQAQLITPAQQKLVYMRVYSLMAVGISQTCEIIAERSRADGNMIITAQQASGAMKTLRMKHMARSETQAGGGSFLHWKLDPTTQVIDKKQEDAPRSSIERMHAAIEMFNQAADEVADDLAMLDRFRASLQQ